MCSNHSPADRPGCAAHHVDAGPSIEALASHAPSVAMELHGVLDRLLSAELAGLGGDELSALVLRLLRAQHRLHAGVLDAVAAFDAADVAAGSRHRSTKRWLELRGRVSAGSAGHLTRSARAVRDHLPETRDALARGLISAQHVSAIVGVLRTVGVDHAVVAEPILLELARGFDASVVRRATARIHLAVDPAGAEHALHMAYERRGVTLSVVGEHGYLNGVFDLESTELLQSALMPLMNKTGEDDLRSVPQRRADALLDLTQRALHAGLDTTLGGERPHVSVVIDEAALRTSMAGGARVAGAGGAAVPWTGAVLPAEVARRWGCDAQLTAVLARLLPPPRSGPGNSAEAEQSGGASSAAALAIGGGWLPMDVGRAARTVTTGQLKALRVRDGGCVHPGCSRTAAYCDAHHVVHWADGGPTNLSNMVLLCRHHHRTLHSGLWSLEPDAGQPGLFWASTAGWQRPAQTAADRSPPIVLGSGIPVWSHD